MDQFDIYLKEMDPKWQDSFRRLFEIITDSIPEGFELVWQYNLPTFVVPLSVYPEGYLDRRDEGVPFISLAAQKKHLALYHMGLMGNKGVLDWFQSEYRKSVPTKLNMGKSCIRFTNPKTIPYELIGELVSKMSMEEWLSQYIQFAEQRKK
ncbi:DUF1801 domain-containing protein [Enterococcus sp. BWB1-3]|uniref:DUF1801 domain-containing protein n=1 Tax=Enterococcus sp. BWB1-3 TaxID=2787713 RepID=UPI001921324E|nr:DUF1801 domain-containing protein [Enterococcus sp. BWB1-3]MBL1229203.1 DUF1801 domain-containing protein [Enterococcus sp. BWB1-3]